MGNCLRSEASDDESLIDSENLGDAPVPAQQENAPQRSSRQGGNRQRRQRGWRNRRRQQQYAREPPVVPDATQYFHFG